MMTGTDDELVVYRGVRKLLSRLNMKSRRLAVNWIVGKFDTWPTIDKAGKPVNDNSEGEPPIIHFINERKSAEEATGTETSGEPVQH